jgi:RNA polymerase sigma-70 factor (ECF subfamily)
MAGASGDEEFEAWYVDQYRRVLASIYLTTGDRAGAAEAVDEAFARAYERWSRVREMQSAAGWTWVVARNALRATRRADRRRTATLRRSAFSERVPPPDMAAEIWDAVRRLPRRQREVIALRYLGGLQEHEIADALGIANGTVARTLHDARHTLAVTLADTRALEDQP